MDLIAQGRITENLIEPSFELAGGGSPIKGFVKGKNTSP